MNPTDNQSVNGQPKKRQYLVEGFTRPGIMVSPTTGQTWIVPYWIPVPGDTTLDQVVHKRPTYRSLDQGHTTLKIPSSKGNKVYTVTKTGNSYKCSCPGYMYHPGSCKHIKYAMEQI